MRKIPPAFICLSLTLLALVCPIEYYLTTPSQAEPFYGPEYYDIYLEEEVLREKASFPTTTPVSTGAISISSSPTDGATIYLDYFDMGQLTNSTLSPVHPGIHAVSITHPSYNAPPPQEGVEVVADETTNVSFNMALDTGSIYVTSSPETGGTIYLDYRDTGQVTPATLNPVSVGPHFVIIRKDGTVPPGIFGADVQAGSTTDVVSELYTSTSSCSIKVSSTPTGADIYLDYLPTGLTTDSTVSPVGYGTHEVVVRKFGYLIPPPQTVELSADSCSASLYFSLLPLNSYYVSTTIGSDITGDGSMANPWATIGKALNTIAGSSECPLQIIVAAGTYYEYELDLEEYVSIYGGYDPVTWSRDIDTYETIVDGSGVPNSTDDIFNGADNSTLNGLTIQDARDKGVMAYYSSPTIESCTFTNCKYAIATGEGAIIRSNIITGSMDAIIGASNEGFTTLIENNLILSSSSSLGGGIASGITSSSTNMDIINNTIDNNESGIRIYHSNTTAPSPTVLIQNNNITRSWPQDGIYVSSDADLNLITARYNNVWKNAPNYGDAADPGDGDLSSDPKYISPLSSHYDSTRGAKARRGYRTSAYDYHLSEGSPCIDRGTNEVAPSDDLDGNTRPRNGVTDIGCYEYQGYLPPPSPPGLVILLQKDTFSPGELLEIWVSFWDTQMDWDAYLLIRGLDSGELYSILLRNRLKRGIHPIVTDALEGHGLYSGRVFSMVVPNIPGNFKIIGGIIPTGWAPTVGNAQGPYGQYAERTFQITP